jgi:hypothetical protein
MNLGFFRGSGRGFILWVWEGRKIMTFYSDVLLVLSFGAFGWRGMRGFLITIAC